MRARTATIVLAAVIAASALAQEPAGLPRLPVPNPAVGDGPSAEEKGKPEPKARPDPEVQVKPGAAAKKKAAPKPDPLERLLSAWERAGAGAGSLRVEFTRADKEIRGASVDEYRGTILFEGASLACLHLESVDRTDPRHPAFADHERLVCDGKQVRLYNYPTRQIDETRLDMPGRGSPQLPAPLPFLYRVRAAELKARYRVEYVRDDETSRLIRVVPRREEDRVEFGRAWVQLDRSSFLPTRVLLVDRRGVETRDYRFFNYRVDEPIRPDYFVASTVVGWKVRPAVPSPVPPAVAGPGEAERRKQ